jgi:hypothetical protein
VHLPSRRRDRCPPYDRLPPPPPAARGGLGGDRALWPLHLLPPPARATSPSRTSWGPSPKRRRRRQTAGVPADPARRVPTGPAGLSRPRRGSVQPPRQRQRAARPSCAAFHQVRRPRRSPTIRPASASTLVVRDRRLAPPERGLDITGAHLAVDVGCDQRQQPEALLHVCCRSAPTPRRGPYCTCAAARRAHPRSRCDIAGGSYCTTHGRTYFRNYGLHHI